MDLLMKRLEDHEKLNGQEVVEAMDARMTCETYGDNGHFGDACPETHKDVNFVNNNNGYRTQENQGRINAPTTKEVTFSMVITIINLLLIILFLVKLK
jgi:hypothetical protein